MKDVLVHRKKQFDENVEDEIKGRKKIRKQKMQNVIITKNNESEICEVRRRVLFSSPENE